jgi:hypothetical protein
MYIEGIGIIAAIFGQGVIQPYPVLFDRITTLQTYIQFAFPQAAIGREFAFKNLLLITAGDA